MENPTQKPLLLLTSKDSPTFSALERWEPTQPSPVAKDELSKAIASLEAGMKPATDREYAEAMLSLIQFAAAFGIACPEPKTVQAIYHEQLKHLPADLLRMAMARIKATWVWRNSMPFPADILNLVREDYAKRQSLLSRARVAMLKAPETTGQRNVIPAEKFEELRRSLRGGIKKMDTTKSLPKSTVAGNIAPPDEEPMTREEFKARKRELIEQCESA